MVTYVPITITNSQSSPTPAPFQQMVQVNSTTYSSLEASNLQNVEFFDSTGAVIPSWLESGASSSSTNTIYWLKIEGGIPAESSITVYMGFASATTNLFNAQTTGEAPALSPSYGEYDNGGSVFTYEWNFAGSSLPSGWAFSQANSSSPDNGGYEVSNGASFYTGSCGEYIQSCANTVYGYFATAFDSGSYVISAEMQSFWNNGQRVWFGGNNGQGVWFGWWSEPQFPTTAGAENGTRPYNGNYVSDFVWCNEADCVQPFEVTGNGGSASTANSYDATQYMVYSLSWQGDNQVGTLTPPSGTPITVSQASSSTRGGSYYLGFWDFTKGMGDNGETAQWVTVSAMPPNGVMPVAIVGSVSPFITINPSLGAAGTPVTITGAGLVASHGLTITFDGSTAGMPTTCTTDVSGRINSGCAFTVPSSSALGNHTVTAGDGTNSPAAIFRVTLLGVTCSRSSVVVDSATTCKATVHESGPKAPTGTVTWSSSSSGTFSKASCKLSKHRTYSTCSAKFTPTAAGPVLLMANYSGDSNNPATAGAYNLIVTMKSTTTTVSCSPKSVVAGSSKVITCKAKVTGYLPTGTVSWFQSGTGSVSFNYTTCTLASMKNPNQATCSVTMTGTTAGKVTIQGTYSGAPNNQGSSRTTTLTIKAPKVIKNASTTTLYCTQTSFDIGTPVVCWALVTGASPTQTGTVAFTSSGNGSIAISPSTCTLSSGICSVNVTATAAGSVRIEAVYSGDSINKGSSQTATLTIHNVPVGLSLQLSVNGTTISEGENVSITATLFNTLNQSNEAYVSYNWPLRGLLMFSQSWPPCGYYSPVELMVLKGNYSLDQLKAMGPGGTPALGCMEDMAFTHFMFEPHSDSVNVTESWSVTGEVYTYGPVSASMTVATNGYWDLNGSLSYPTSYAGLGHFDFLPAQHVFLPGVYTVATADEWGQMTVVHLTVG